MKRKPLFGGHFNAIAVIGITLGAGGLFKCAAFAREAFIASHFGLTAVTDVYFGLQQFPLSLATFMFGAFALAFTPAYAEAKGRHGEVEWLPGLLFYGCLIGAAMMGGMIVCGKRPVAIPADQGVDGEGVPEPMDFWLRRPRWLLQPSQMQQLAEGGLHRLVR